MTVGERIKELRTKLGMSQVDFADKINVSKQTLYKYENNIITNIPSDKVEEAARIGNVSPAYLMGWNKEEATADKLLETYESNIHSDEQLNRIIGYYNDMNQPDRDMLESMAKRFAEANKKDDN